MSSNPDDDQAASSSSRSALDGDNWRYNAQRSFLDPMTPVTPGFDTTSGGPGGGFPHFDSGDDDHHGGDLNQHNNSFLLSASSDLNTFTHTVSTSTTDDNNLSDPPPLPTTRPLKTSRGLRLGQQMGSRVANTTADPGPSSTSSDAQSYQQSQSHQERLQGLQREMGLNIAMPDATSPPTTSTASPRTRAGIIPYNHPSDAPSQGNDWNRANRMAQSSFNGLSSAYKHPDARDHTKHQPYDDSTTSVQSGSSGHRELLLPAINGARAATSQPRRTTSALHLRNARDDLHTVAPSDAKKTHDDDVASTRTSSPDVVRPRSSATRKDALSDLEIAKLGAIDGQDPHSLLPTDGTQLTSKNVLTIALAKAQSAVTHDSGNNVPEAIHSYGQAVRLLQEVMDRIAPRQSSKRKSTRQEERRRLKVIHDTYTDRIRLLSLIYGPENNIANETSQAKSPVPDLPADGDTPAAHPAAPPPSASVSSIPMPSNESEEILADKSPTKQGDDDAASHHQRSDSDASFQSVASMPITASASNVIHNQPVSTEQQGGNHSTQQQGPAAEQTTDATATAPLSTKHPVINVEHSRSVPDSHHDQHPDRQRPRAATVSSPLASPSRPPPHTDPPAPSSSSHQQTPQLQTSSSSDFGASADTGVAIALSEASSPAVCSRRFGPSDEEPLDEQAKASMRRRAMSQPGSKRPPLPQQQQQQQQQQQSLQTKPPPLPRMARKISLPGLNVIKAQQQGSLKAQGPHSALSSLSPLGAPSQDSRSVLQRPDRFPSPSPSFASGYHALVEDGPQTSMPGNYDATGLHQTGLSAPTAQDSLFPTGLASAQTYGLSSMHSSRVEDCPLLKQSVRTLNLAADTPPQAPLSMSVNPVLRPFTQARALSRSIASSGFITSKLCVPSHVWAQSGTKLSGLETKVRLIELVANGIDAIEKSGSHLLSPPKGQPGLAAVQSAGFAKQLEDFDALLIEVQNTFSKKLGVVDAVAGRKGSSLGSFGSKMARSIDRMALTNSGKNMDLPAAYIDSLTRLFGRVEVLHLHTATLLQAQRSSGGGGGGRNGYGLGAGGGATTDAEAVEAYANLATEVRQIIESKLLRSSEFFSSVLIKIVLKDLHVLMDKWIKYSSVALGDLAAQ